MNRPAALRRCSGALALTVLVAVGVGPGTAAAATATTTSSAEIAAQVRQLDRDVDRVGAELARGAAAYEQAQARLAARTSDAFAARGDAEAKAAQAAAAEASRGELARAAYKGGVPPLVAALLSGDPGAVADLAYVRRSVDALGARRTGQVLLNRSEQQTADFAVASSDAERRSALAERQALDAQLAALVRRADELSAELAVTADALARARAVEATRARQAAARQDAARQAAARRAAAASALSSPVLAGPLVPVDDVPPSPATSSAGCQPPGGLREANGFLSPATLCPLAAGGGHRLRTDAARAFDRLSAAYAASVGKRLCITDSYRSYAAQVDVFKRKPRLAATPGRSQHGWGLAVDLCGGVQVFGSAAHEWMRANAGQFGWTHPRWAQQGGSKPEPWHWEYVGVPAR